MSRSKNRAMAFQEVRGPFAGDWRSPAMTGS
jgi:hypothetical protein